MKIYENLGNAYYYLSDYKNAVESYKKVLSVAPRNIGSLFGLANTYYKMGMLDEAIMYYQKIIEIDRYNYYAYNNLGTIYVQKNRPVVAREYFKRAIEIAPQYKGAKINYEIVNRELNVK